MCVCTCEAFIRTEELRIGISSQKDFFVYTIFVLKNKMKNHLTL